MLRKVLKKNSTLLKVNRYETFSFNSNTKIQDDSWKIVITISIFKPKVTEKLMRKKVSKFDKI